MELDTNKKQLLADTVQKIKTAQQITDKLVVFCKDTIVASLTYKKFDIDRGLEAYLALLSEKSLLSDKAIRIIYFYKLAKKDLKLKSAKLSDIFEEYVETLVMLQGSITNLNKILNNPQVRKYAQDLDFVINYFRRVSAEIAKFTESEDPEVAAIFGADEDDGVVNVGGFYDTPVVTYPVGVFNTDNVGNVGKASKTELFTLYRGQIDEHLNALVENLLAYLAKRDNSYTDTWSPSLGSEIKHLKLLLQDLLSQDQKIFREKLLDRFANTTLADYQDLLGLGINPYARITLLRTILAAFSDVEKLDFSIDDPELDKKFADIYSGLNIFGYSLEQLLSPENKGTCVNNIAYYVGYIVLAQRDYLVKKDPVLRETVTQMLTQHPELNIGPLYNPATEQPNIEAIMEKANLFLHPNKIKYYIQK